MNSSKKPKDTSMGCFLVPKDDSNFLVCLCTLGVQQERVFSFLRYMGSKSIALTSLIFIRLLHFNYFESLWLL